MLNIFVDLILDNIEVFMDKFITYAYTFDEALTKLETTLKRWIDSQIFLSNEVFFMMMNQGIVSRHHISVSGIQVDLTKIINIDQRSTL